MDVQQLLNPNLSSSALAYPAPTAQVNPAPSASPPSASSPSASSPSASSPSASSVLQIIQQPYPPLATNTKPRENRPENDYKAWKIEELLKLINVTFEDGDGWESIAAALKRSESSCQVKYRKFFLDAGAKSAWIFEDYKIVSYFRKKGLSPLGIAKWVSHSPADISEKCKNMPESTDESPAALDIPSEFWRQSPIVVANETLRNRAACKTKTKREKPWTLSEENYLVDLREKRHMTWYQIAMWMPRRSRDSCRDHYVVMFPDKNTRKRRAV